MANQINLLLSFLWAFAVAVFAIPSIIHVAHLKNLLDEPNFRTMHTSLTPRLGGLAIYAGFISALSIFGKVTPEVQQIMAGSLLLFFIGMKDDIVAISAAKKFFVQLLAAGIVVFMGNIRITSMQGLLGIYELPDGISYGLSFLTIVGVVNAINLIDGLDGLAGSITMFISATFGFYFYTLGYYAEASIAIALFGALVGFLRYNITKATIFMGDTGSLVCGFIVSVLAIRLIEIKEIPAAPSIALATLAVPVFDTVRVFATRMINGKSPFSPDKTHIHHILSKMGMPQLYIVITLVSVNGGLVFLATVLKDAGNNVLVAGLMLFFVASSAYLWLQSKNQRKPQEQVTMLREVLEEMNVESKQKVS